MQKWERLQSTRVFESRFFSVRKDVCRLPDGREIDDYYVVENPNVALVVARTVEGEFLLVEEYKHGIGDISLEIVGGLIDKKDDNPLSAAKRELREETGYESYEWIQLASFVNDSTRTNNRIYVFLALDVYQAGEQSLDENEAIQVHQLGKEQILEKIRKGSINVSNSVAGLMMAFDYLK